MQEHFSALRFPSHESIFHKFYTFLEESILAQYEKLNDKFQEVFNKFRHISRQSYIRIFQPLFIFHLTATLSNIRVSPAPIANPQKCHCGRGKQREVGGILERLQTVRSVLGRFIKISQTVINNGGNSPPSSEFTAPAAGSNERPLRKTFINNIFEESASDRPRNNYN